MYKLKESWKDGIYTFDEPINKQSSPMNTYIGTNIVVIKNNCIMYYVTLQTCVEDPFYEVYIGMSVSLDENDKAKIHHIHDSVRNGWTVNGGRRRFQMADKKIRNTFLELLKDAEKIENGAYFDDLKNFVY